MIVNPRYPRYRYAGPTLPPKGFRGYQATQSFMPPLRARGYVPPPPHGIRNDLPHGDYISLYAAARLAGVARRTLINALRRRALAGFCRTCQQQPPELYPCLSQQLHRVLVLEDHARQYTPAYAKASGQADAAQASRAWWNPKARAQAAQAAQAQWEKIRSARLYQGLISIPDAARRVGVWPHTLRYALRRGWLRGLCAACRVRIPSAQLSGAGQHLCFSEKRISRDRRHPLLLRVADLEHYQPNPRAQAHSRALWRARKAKAHD